MSIREQVEAAGRRAKAAAAQMALVDMYRKNEALAAMADGLEAAREEIEMANGADLFRGRQAGMPPAMQDRLLLTDERIRGMARGLRELIALPDPVGKRIGPRIRRPNGLVITKVCVPIGVIAIIYEARPNVTADAAGLCIKASNAVILRGGSEALQSNRVIARVMAEAGEKAGLPGSAVQLVEIANRKAVRELVRLKDYVDLAMPRGGEGLINAVTEMALVPVIKHYKGVCHIYVDKSADQEKALRIIENAKCQRPGVCNAVEKVLVHAGIAAEFIPKMAALLRARGVELRGDEASRKIEPGMKRATEKDWTEEYLDLILTVGVTPSTQAAVDHINRFGSHHSDAIISRSRLAQRLFMRQVDSAAVYVNASTRFTDGGEFGMGAEIGISTDKLHARGPMGVAELTTYKYVVEGNGHIR